jgi:hypothetical protein
MLTLVAVGFYVLVLALSPKSRGVRYLPYK